jgi:hypothetical protein
VLLYNAAFERVTVVVNFPGSHVPVVVVMTRSRSRYLRMSLRISLTVETACKMFGELVMTRKSLMMALMCACFLVSRHLLFHVVSR